MKIIRKSMILSSFLRTDPSVANLDRKRKSFRGLGKWSKPERRTRIDRQNIANVDVDVINNSPVIKFQVVYIHGGGFVYGGNSAHLHMLSMLSREAQATIYAVEYKISPEHPYPVAQNEIISLYKEVARSSNLKIVIIGDSAGGNLALTSLVKIRDSGDKLPYKAVLISPLTDATFTNRWITDNANIDPLLSKDKLEFFLAAYAGELDRKTPGISPIYAELNNLPPLLFHVGSDEVLFGDSKLIHEKILKSSGLSELYVGKGLWHAWHLYTKYMPESRQAIQHIADFITT